MTKGKEKMSIWTKIKDLFVEEDDMPKSMRRGKGIFVFCMVIVSLLHFFIFYVGVNYNSIVLAFRNLDFIDEQGVAHYIYSLQNFKNFFIEMSQPDTVLPIAFKNTLKYFVLDSFVLFPIGVIVSYFLYKKTRGHKAFRVIFYLPALISGVVVVATFKGFTSLGGPLHQLMYNVFGLELPSLYSAEYSTATIMAYCVWTGLSKNFILLTGAMSRIPEEVIESAKMDGVSWGRELVQIVIPLIWDTVATLFIMSFIGIFQASGPIMLFNTGEESWTISYWIFKQVTAGSYSYPAAVGLLLTLISFPIVMLVRWILSKVEGVEY